MYENTMQLFIYLFKIDSVRTIRSSCNYVYFVYYYTDVCDLLQNIDPRLFLPHN